MAHGNTTHQIDETRARRIPIVHGGRQRWHRDVEIEFDGGTARRRRNRLDTVLSDQYIDMKHVHIVAMKYRFALVCRIRHARQTDRTEYNLAQKRFNYCSIWNIDGLEWVKKKICFVFVGILRRDKSPTR